ncbi:hypothetical protein JVU11DRAFT_12665 [Chiua virens]|nr:hypothetical protein JVU11DRAFT_12665 [Chiua virens]
MYVLLFVVILLLGWYVWGIVVLFERLKEEVGWWDIIVGDSGGIARWEGWGSSGFGSERQGAELEGSLEALANALGVSPVQVASAVKPLVPQASLASVASKMEGMGGSEAVSVLFEDTTRSNRDHQTTSTGTLNDQI